MTPMTAIIADDESLLRRGLKRSLETLWPELDICCEAANGIEALAAVDKYHPDIAFLDIRMPGLNGLQVAEKIYDRCRVVFITAFDQYAVEAFDTEAFDYILKPVDENRLKRTCDRLKQALPPDRRSPGMDRRIRDLIRKLEQPKPDQYLKLIKVRHGSDLQFVPVSDVFFFMARDKYTTIRTHDREFLIRTPVKELESRLDPDRFWRVHRSAIVNADKIYRIKRTYTYRMIICFEQMTDTVPISRSYEHLFRET